MSWGCGRGVCSAHDQCQGPMVVGGVMPGGGEGQWRKIDIVA